MTIHLHILFSHVSPQLLHLGEILWSIGYITDHRGYNGDGLKVGQHVVSQIVLFYRPWIEVINHTIVHIELLVDTLYHGLLSNRLAVTTDIVAVEVHIQVVNGLHIWQWLEYKEVIHIEGVLWQVQSTLTKHLCAISNRVHENCESLDDTLHAIPTGDLICWEHVVVDHTTLMIGGQLLIDIVGQKHIYWSTLVH